MDTSITSIHIEDGVNGYVDLVHHVLKNGRNTSPRGMLTREIEDATIWIDNIYSTLPLGVGRGAVPGIGSVEACQLLGGVSLPELVIAVGPQFKNYAEDNGIFHGAYGLRTAGQYEEVVQKLQEDPDTRQAVVTIWDPEYDNQPKKRDYPCTVLHQFRLRDNKLNMSVYMRSNDVWLGAAYDFFQFTRVQLALCSILGVQPGTYAHHVGSLHIYEQHFEVAEDLKKTTASQSIPFIQGSTWQDVKKQATDALLAVTDDKILPRLSQNAAWYAGTMIEAVSKNARKASQ